MKKTIFSIFIFSIIISSCNINSNKNEDKSKIDSLAKEDSLKQINLSCVKNDLSEMRLKGKVKTLIESTYEISPSKKLELTNNNLIDRYTYKFNSNGFEEEVTHMTSKNEDFFTNFKKIIFYDNSGKKNKFDYFNLHGQKLGIGEYKYDKFGNVVEEIWNDIENTKVLEKTINKYFVSGILKESTSFNSSGKMIQSYIYDSVGNLIEYIYPMLDNINSKQVSSYDSKNNEIAISFFLQNQFLAKWDIKYEKFDLNGNWIKKSLFDNENIIQIVIREINYN